MVDPWFAQNPQWTVNVQRGGKIVTEPKKFCKDPSPGYRAIPGLYPHGLPNSLLNPRWETASGALTWGTAYSSNSPVASTCVDIAGLDRAKIIKKTAIPPILPTHVHQAPTPLITQTAIRTGTARVQRPSTIAKLLEPSPVLTETVLKPSEPSSVGRANSERQESNETSQRLVLGLKYDADELGGKFIRRQSGLGNGFLDPNAYRFMEDCQDELADIDPCDNDPQLLCGSGSSYIGGSGDSSGPQGIPIPRITPTNPPMNNPTGSPPPPGTTSRSNPDQNSPPDQPPPDQPPPNQSPPDQPPPPPQRPPPPPDNSVPRANDKGAPLYMIILVKYPSGELSNIGQNLYGDKVVGPEEDICKAKPLWELPVSPKIVVPAVIENIEVFGDRCMYREEFGKVFLKVRKGEIIGRLYCDHLLQAICSRISDGRSNDGSLKCPNLGVTFYNAVSCLWIESLKRFQGQDIEYDKLGFGNATIGG
jgi:hypothetical protein